MFRPESPWHEETEQEEDVKSVESSLKNQTFMTDFFPIVRGGVVSYFHWELFHAVVPGVVRIILLPTKPLLQTFITQFFDIL